MTITEDATDSAAPASGATTPAIDPTIPKMTGAVTGMHTAMLQGPAQRPGLAVSIVGSRTVISGSVSPTEFGSATPRADRSTARSHRRGMCGFSAAASGRQDRWLGSARTSPNQPPRSTAKTLRIPIQTPAVTRRSPCARCVSHCSRPPASPHPRPRPPARPSARCRPGDAEPSEQQHRDIRSARRRRHDPVCHCRR